MWHALFGCAPKMAGVLLPQCVLLCTVWKPAFRKKYSFLNHCVVVAAVL